jgi:hypothetical protein
LSEETLFTAARRLVRDLNIDLGKGGIVTTDTQMSLHKLEVQIVKQQKRDEQARFLEEERKEKSK